MGRRGAGAGSRDTQAFAPYAGKHGACLLPKLNKHISGDQRYCQDKFHSLRQSTSGQSLPAALNLALPIGYPRSQSRATVCV